MTVAVARDSVRGPGKQEIYRYSQASAATMPQTCSTPGTRVEELLFVTVAYSATGSTLSCVATLNSGVGPTYDVPQNVTQIGEATNAYAWAPTGVEYVLLPGDALDVYAPTGASGETSQIAIYTKAL